MRVAYLCGTYPAISHTFITREVHALRALDVDVQTFSVRPSGPENLVTEADRFEARNTPSIQPPRPATLVRAHVRAAAHRPGRYLGTLWRALRLSPPGVRERLWHGFYFAEAMILWLWCRERGISHVHAHFANAASAICLLCAEYGASDGFSWSYTMHGQYEFDDVGRYRLAEKVRSASFVACVSDYARAQLMRLAPSTAWNRLHVVRCGVDPAVYRAEPRPDADDGPVRVLTVNRLVAGKGLPLLLEAVAELRRTGRDVELTFVGDGPERSELERRAAELEIAANVRFTGTVGQDVIRAHYAAADIFCLPSFAEGIPVVVMEAMAMELPVVATQVMGVPELVTDGVSGLLVRPGRVDELVEALATLADDPSLRRSLGSAGRAKVQESHDVHTEALLLTRLFGGEPAVRAPSAEVALP